MSVCGVLSYRNLNFDIIMINLWRSSLDLLLTFSSFLSVMLISFSKLNVPLRFSSSMQDGKNGMGNNKKNKN